MTKVPLRNRFWLVSMAFITASFLLFVLLITTLFTPKVADRLVRLDEEKRLREADPHSAVDVKIVGPAEVRTGEIFIRLNEKECLVSLRHPSSWEALRVVRPSPMRVLVGLLTWLALVYLLSSLLARFVNKPIKDLADGVRALSQGERGVTVAIPRETELAELAHGFNEMSAQLGRRERELEQALDAKELMFASTNHELRTPLTVILGYCQMLEDGMKGELTPGQRQCTEIIHRNATGLLQQVEMLLTHSQLSAGSLPLRLEVVDGRDLAQQMVDELSPLAQEKGLELRLSVPPREALLKIDFKQGRQIVRNLIENAIKFTAHGVIEVEVSTSQGQVQFRVQDSGPGVSVAFEDRLFQEFSRGPSSEGIEGTGLGLALSQRLAKRMGGEIRLLENSDRGALFAWTQPESPTELSKNVPVSGDHRV